ncbi:MAG TPA: hypothetical protein VFL65_00910 [Jatrophihabitans sp.]|nr:hypothetical protein [Jatrophihabitans sp.]
MQRLIDRTSRRGRQIWVLGMAITLAALVLWITLPHRGGWPFFVWLAFYVAGFILIWAGVFVSKRDQQRERQKLT